MLRDGVDDVCSRVVVIAVVGNGLECGGSGVEARTRQCWQRTREPGNYHFGTQRSQNGHNDEDLPKRGSHRV
jgi:hypothetical protein